MSVAIETPRLRLSPHVATDFDESAAMWAHAEVTRFIGGRPATRSESWARLLRYAGHWALLGFGYWAVRESVSGRFVGEVGFADFQRDMTPSFEGVPEMGWALAPWAHGQGFATEACEAALAWGERRFGAGRIVCMIDPANTPSLKVAEKLGFREYARTIYGGAPTLLFERTIQ